jgi:hypothetical protein
MIPSFTLIKRQRDGKGVFRNPNLLVEGVLRPYHRAASAT